jgi:Flp pilus assembly protein TadG
MRKFFSDFRRMSKACSRYCSDYSHGPLIGAVTLSVEVGLWALTRAKLQGAADAAAISAVLSDDADYADVARAMASANGFDDGVTVTREACPSFSSPAATAYT